MGNFLRRVMAFLLGIVFTITSMIGGVVGGAYYAYKTAQPLKQVVGDDPNLGTLPDATIEDLVDLIANGMDPGKYGEYTIERLMQEYDMDLATFLSEKLGMDVSGIDTESKDWKALTSFSLSSVLTGDFDKILNSIKLRSLYVLAPAVLSGPIDNFLSPEAQSALGDYSIAELIGTTDGSTNDLGIVQALKNLKIGSLLPEIFDYKFDVSSREYVYSVKQDGALKNFAFLDLVGNVPFKGIFNIVEGKDVMTELFEGEFKPLTSMRIADILDSFAKVAGDDIAGTISQYTKIFGDVTVADLFVKNAEGAYEFAANNLLGGLQFGYLVGLTKNADGEWVDSEGKAPTGIIAFVADLSLEGIVNGDGDVIAMINGTIGNLSLKTIIETVYPREEYPLLLDRLGSIKVSDILGGGTDKILDNLKLSFRVALNGVSLEDVLDMVLEFTGDDGSLKESIVSNKVVKALLTIEINSFIRDEYTAKDIITVFKDAIGDLTVGDAAGVEPTDDAIGLLWDYKLSNIFNGVISILDGGKASDIVGAFIGQYKVGDIFGAFTGYRYSETEDNWTKDGKHIGKGLVPLMKTSVSEFVKIFEKDSGFDVTTIVGDIQIADVAYTVLQIIGLNDILVESNEGDFVTYVAGGDFSDFAPLSKVVLTLTVNDFINNVASGDFWLGKLGQIAIGDLTAYVVNNVLDFDVKFTYNDGKWIVDSEYLPTLINNAANTTIGGIIDAVKDGKVKDKIIENVGDTSIGDIVYAVLGIAKVSGIVQKGTDGYEMANDFADFNNLAKIVFGLSVTDIVNNVADVDWWFNKLGSVKVGDAVAYFINKFAPGMSATFGSDGWSVNGKLSAVLTGLFNVTVSELRDPDASKLIRETFGELSIGDVVGEFIPEPYVSKKFVATILLVTVNDIIDMIQSKTAEELVQGLQNAFKDLDIGDLIDVFADLSAYDYGVISRVFGTDFHFIFGLITASDIMQEVIAKYGDISLGEIAYTVLKTMGIEDVIVPEYGTAGRSVRAAQEVIGYTVSDKYADFIPLGDKVLTVSFDEVYSNLNGEYWVDRMGEVSVGDVSAYVINQVLALDGLKLTHNGDKWEVQSDYLQELLENLINVNVSAVSNAVAGKDDGVLGLISQTLGSTYVGDVVYSILNIVGVTDVITEGASASGYEIPEAYQELNEIAQVVLGLQLSDIVNNFADGEFWLNKFDAITVGDVVDIVLPDDLETNEFLAAVRGISVNEVRGWIGADLNAVIGDLRNDFDDVTLQHAVNLFYAQQISNDALARILETEVDFLLSLFTTETVLDDILHEFGDVDLDLIVGQYLGDAVYDNAFVSATLGFGVNTVRRILSGENVIDVICSLYDEVTIGDAINAIYDTSSVKYNPLTTVCGLKINDVIDAVTGGTIVNFLIEKFGEVSIGDVILPRNVEVTLLNHAVKYDGGWVVTGELGELFTNVLNVNLDDILDNVENQNNLRANILELVGNTTIGNAGKLIYANDLGIGALDYIYGIKLSTIVNEIFDGTILNFLLSDVVFEITLDDVVGFIIPSDIRTNAFVESTLSVNTNKVLQIVGQDTVQDILMQVSYVYDGVDFGDIFALVGLEEAPISSLKPIFNAGIDDLIQAIANNEILDYVMNDVIGALTVDDVITDIETLTGAAILGDLRYNAFIGDVLSISVGTVYNAVTGENVLYDIGGMFVNSTIADVIEIFVALPEIDYLQTLCTINIGETLQGIATGDLTKLTETLITVFEQLPEGVQYGIIAGVGVAGVVLYFVDNATLVEIVNYSLGEGKTWGELLAETLGYSYIDGEYVSTIGYNGLMDTMLKETVAATLTAGYPLLDTIKAELTLGNLLTVSANVGKVIEAAIGMNFIETANGLALDGDFRYLSDSVLNLSLGDFLTSENVFIDGAAVSDLMMNTFGSNDIGDLAAYFINLLSAEPVAEKVSGKWTVEGMILSEIVSNILNITYGEIHDAITAEDKTPYIEKAKSLFGDTNLGDVAYSIVSLTGNSDVIIESAEAASKYVLGGGLEDFNDLAQIVFGVKLVEIVDNVTNGEYWLNLVKPVELGYIVNYFLSDELKANDFIAATTSISVENVLGWTSSSVNEIVSDLQTKYAAVEVNDVVAIFYANEIQNEALKEIVAINFADLLGLITTTDLTGNLLDLFGDITLNKAVGQYLGELRYNEFIAATLSISVNAIVDMFGEKGVLGVVKELYDGVIIGDVIEIIVAVPDTKFTNVLAAIQIVDVIDAIVDGKVLDFLHEKFADITIGDIAYSVVTILGAQGVIEETSAGYVLGEGLEELEGLADVTFAVKVVELAENFANGDWWKANFASVSVGNAIDVILPEEVEEMTAVAAIRAITVGDIVDIVTANTTDARIAKLQDIFEGVNVHHLLGSETADLIGNKAVESVLDTSVNYLLGLIVSEDVLSAIRLEFNDITVGSIVAQYINIENDFLSATYSLGVDHVFQILGVNTLNEVLAIVKDVYEGVTIDDVLSLGVSLKDINGALDKILDSKINDIIDIIISDDVITAIGNAYGSISLGDALTDVLSTVINVFNPFVDATLSIKVQTVLDLIKATTTEELLSVIYGVYEGVTVYDLIDVIVTPPTLVQATNNIYDLVINDIIKASVEGEIVDFLYEKFGDVRLGDIAFNTEETANLLGYEISYVGDAWSVTSESLDLDELFTNVLNVTFGSLKDDVTGKTAWADHIIAIVGATTIGELGDKLYNNELGIGVLSKLYGLGVGEIIRSAFNGTILNYLKDFAFDITIHDVVGFLISDEGIRDNAFVKATLGVNANTVIDIVNAGSTSAVLNAVADLYKGVKFIDITSLVGVKSSPLETLAPVFDASIETLIRKISDGALGEYVLDVVGSICVENVVNDVEKLTGATILGELRYNELISALLGISVKDVRDVIVEKDVLNDLGDIFLGVTVEDAVSIFVALPEIEYLKTLCSIDIGATLKGVAANDYTELTETLTDAYNQLPAAAQYAIIAGAGVVGTVLYFVDNAKLVEIVNSALGDGKTWGDLLAATFGYSLNGEFKYESVIGYNGLMDVMFSETVEETLTTGYPLLDTVKAELTLGNLLTANVDLANTIEASIGMTIVETADGFAFEGDFKNLSNSLFNLALGDFLTVDNKLKDGEAIKNLMLDTFGSNDIGDLTAFFLNLLSKDGVPVAEKLGGKWMVDGPVLPEVIANVLNVTVREIYDAITAADKTEHIEKALDLFGDTNLGDIIYSIIGLTGSNDILAESTETASGYALNAAYGDFDDLAQIVLGIEIVDVVKNAASGEYWLGLVKPVKLGYIVNFLLSDELKANSFISATTSISVEDVIGWTKGVKDLVQGLQTTYDGVQVKNIVETFYKGEYANLALQKLVGVKLSDLLGLIVTEDLEGNLVAIFGDVSVGDVVSSDNDNGTTFRDETFAIDVSDVYGLVKNLINGQGVDAIFNWIKSIYVESAISDIVTTIGFKVDNAALEKIIATKITEVVDIITSDDVLSSIRAKYGDITVGDAIKGYVPASDNAFLDATYAFSVDTVFEMLGKNEPMDALKVVADLYEGVTIRNFLETIDGIAGTTIVSTGSTNDALYELMALEFNDIARAIVAEDKAAALLDLVGHITVGYAISKDPARDTAFLNETYDISVRKVYDLVTSISKGKVAIADAFKAIYPTATVDAIVKSFGDVKIGNAALAKLANVKLATLADIAISEDILNSALTTFGDVSLGDAVSQYIKVEDNAFLNATYQFSVSTISEMIDAGSVTGALKVVANLYNGVTVGDVLALAGVKNVKNEALNKLFDIELLAIAKVATADDKVWAVVDLVDDITVGNAISKEPSKDTKFLKETYAISVKTVYDLATSKSLKGAIDVIKGVYAESSIADVMITLNFKADNDALQKIVDTTFVEILNIATSENVLASIRSTFGDITLGDAIKGYVPVGDNAFLDATYAFSVDTVFAMLEPTDPVEALKIFANLYDGVKVCDVVELIDGLANTSIATVNNAALKKLYAIELLDIAKAITAGDKIGEILKLVGDITVGDVLNKAEDVNKFKAETYAISVKTVYDLVKSGSLSGAINGVKDIYKESALSDVITTIGFKTENVALNKVLDTKIARALEIATSKDILSEIHKEFGEITVQDAIGDLVKGKVDLTNAFVAATLGVSVDKVFEMIDAGSVTGALKVFANLYDGVVIGDIVKLVDDLAKTKIYAIDNAALRKVCAIELLDIAKAITAGDKIGAIVNLVGDITVADVLNKSTDNANKFKAETLAISVNTIYGLVKSGSLSGVVTGVKGIYKESALSDAVQVVGFKTENVALNKVLDTKIARIADIVLSSGKRAEIRKELGDITLDDAVGGLVGKFVDVNNVFVKETLGLSVEHIFKVLDNLSLGNAVRVAASLYETSTLSDVVKVVLPSFSTSRDSINVALSLKIGSAMTAVADRNLTFYKDYAKSVYGVMTRNEKLLLVGVAGVGAGALYFVKNDLLVSLVDKVLGEGATFGDIISGVFGYEEDDDGKYVINGIYNSLMNKFLSEEIATFLTKGYPYFETYRHDVSIGNLVTLHSAITNVFAKLKLPVAQDKNGNIFLSGYLANITRSIFSLKLDDVLTADKKLVSGPTLRSLIHEKFDSNVLGDVLGILVNNQKFIELSAEYSDLAGQWVVEGKGAGFLTRLMNVSFIELYNVLKNKDYTVISELIGDTTLLNIATAVKPSLANNKTAVLVLSLKVKDVIDLVRGRTSLGALIGGWTLGELAGDYLPSSINKDSAFAQVFLNLTISDLNVIKNNPLQEAVSRFGNFTFGEALGFVGYDASSNTDELVKTVLDLKLDVFAGGANAGLQAIVDAVKGKELGLILGYEKRDDGWYNGGTKLTGILATVAGKNINDISDPDFFNNLKLGEALGYTEGADGWYDGETKVTGIMATFAGKMINEISSNPGGIIDTVVLGEALGYTKDGGKWTKGTGESAKELTGALASLADKTIGDLSGDPDFIDDLTIAEILGYTNEGTETDPIWKDSDGKPVTGVMAAFAGKSIKDISNDPDAAINTVVLGEALGYTKDGGKWTKGTGESAKELTGALASLADKTIGELANDPNFIDDMKLGEALGYTPVKDGEGNVTGWTNNGADVTGIMAKFASLSIGGLNDAEIREQINTLKLNEVIAIGDDTHPILKALGDTEIRNLSTGINDIKLGTALGYTEGTDGKWYTDAERTSLVTGVMSILAGKKISEISGNATDIINGIELGTALGYTKDGDVWTDSTGAAVTGIMKSFVDVKIGDLNETKMKNIVNDLTLGDVITIDTSSVKVLQSLKDAKIGELGDKFNDLELGQVIDCSGNNILAALENVKITSMSSEINDMKLGTVMGYTYNETTGTWLKDGVAVTDGLAKKLADKTVSEIGNNGLKASDFTVGDVFTKTGGTDAKTDALIDFIGADTKLDSVPSTITTNFETITVSTAINLGIFGNFFDDDPTRTDDNYDKIDGIFRAQYTIDNGGSEVGYTDAVWKNMEFVDFMQAIFDMIPTI